MLFEEFFTSRRLEILKLGCMILTFQNLAILFLPFVGYWSGLWWYVSLVLHFDLIGFSLLAIGYVSYSPRSAKGERGYFIGGLFFFSWVVLRVVNQYFVPLMFDFSELINLRPHFSSVPSIAFYPFFYNLAGYFILGAAHLPTPPLLILQIYIVNSILLLLAFIFCEQSYALTSRQKKSRKNLTYPILNLIASFLLIITPLRAILVGAPTFRGESQLGLGLPKVFIVPFFGILTFSTMHERLTKESPESLKTD